MNTKTIAAHTLGCKVNQYDTQAMLELFQRDGWTVVSIDGDADAYLVNTCTVTGVGDKKSLQLIRPSIAAGICWVSERISSSGRRTGAGSWICSVRLKRPESRSVP